MKMKNDKAQILTDTLIEAVTKPGWRKIVIGCGEAEVLALEEWLSRQGRGFAETSQEVVNVTIALGQRRVVILVEPEWKAKSFLE